MGSTNGRLLRMLAGLALALVLAPGAVSAQYFGQNKVQYESFDFEILSTDHFDIYYYEEERPALEFVALMAERWYARLARLLNHDLSGRQPLIVYASAPHFRQTNTLQGTIGESTGGVTEILKRRIVLPLAGPLAETDHVLGHELVHAFQFDITGEGGGVALAGIPAALRYPLWFTEGMAEYLSLGPADPNTALWMRDAVREELPNIDKLNDPRFFPYRYGHALWAFVAGRWGDDVVGRILKASRSAGNPALAFGRVLRMAPDSVVALWHRATREQFLPIRQETVDPSDYGRLLTTRAAGWGDLNVSPALSPDGSRIVYFSERNLFSIDMFVANVATGEVIRRVTRTDVDPHFESLGFIQSAGAWHPDGRRFVFTAVTKGRPALTVVDIETGAIEREIPLRDVGEVFTPSWSPDGSAIVFSALVGGLSDLFLYDLAADTLRRLTQDGYADLHPAWSPDGKWIAFATDRFTTGLASLLHGNYRLALLDPRSGSIRPLPAFERGKQINPQWAPDAKSVYFVSDQNGIPNLYRVEVETGELFQLTNLYTGVSGITALSPAISVAQRSGELVMTVYERDGYRLWLMEVPEVLAGGQVLAPFADVDPGFLPPSDRLTNEVAGLLANAFYGLPQSTEAYGTRDYRPRLSLDYIAQPSLAIGVDRFGTFIAGGASLFWSDMLGGHNLATALQVYGGIKDLAGLVGYTNLNRRLNWGASVQQYPLRYQFIEGGVLQDGSFLERLTTFRQTSRQAVVGASYPLSRVSRLEASGGFLNVTYDYEQRIRLFVGNLVALDTTIELLTPPSLNVGLANLAYVYDNSFFGWTSPVLGQRYRVEVGSYIGSLAMYTGLLDYRRYVMPKRPFTLAFRVMHYGRYGRDADDFQRLQPLFMGYDGLLRGYEPGSFDLFDPEELDAYFRLFGSRMLIGNAELRFPPLALFGGGSGLFGFLPVDAILFADAGVAWHDDDPTTTVNEGLRLYGLFDGGRNPLYSAGFGVRMNVFGLMIIELDWVYPFNRGRGGHLQFAFTPGF